MGGIPISVLMIGTLFAAFVIGAILWLRHMRKPENRHPMADQPERNIAQVLDDARADEDVGRQDVRK